MIYDKITLYDKQKVDYLLVLDAVATQEQIDQMNDYYVIPDWDMFDDIKILAPFTEDLISSYISGLKSPVIGFHVYRQKIGDSVLHKVAEVDYETYEILDYLVANRNEYKYLVIPVTENEFGVSLESNTIKTNWTYWTLTQLFEATENVYLAQDVWVLELDVSSEAREYNLDKTVFNGYTKYPKVSVGKRNYITGGMTCKIGHIECPTKVYTDTVDMIKAWREFVGSETPALLRDRKGNMWFVHLNAGSETTIDNLNQQPTEISFSFVEIDDPDNILVYSKV